jgi:Bacterial extracellular solute-binding protein
MAPSLSRRGFLRGTLGLPLGAGTAALLASCGGAAAQIATPDNPVLWPISGDNRPIEAGLQPERNATLRLYNWEDYINADVIKAFERRYKAFNVKVEVSTFANASDAVSNVEAGKADYDILFVTYDLLGQLVLGGHVRPLTSSYIPNIGQVWPVFQNPFYDQDWRYSVPYTVYTTGIGWRADKVHEDVAKMADPYEILWGSRYRGKVGVLDEYRETIGMVLLKNGITDLNTTRPRHLELVRKDLRDLALTTQPVVDVNAYQDPHRQDLGVDGVLGRPGGRARIPSQGLEPRGAALLVPARRSRDGRQRPHGRAALQPQPGAGAPLPEFPARFRCGHAQSRVEPVPAATGADRPHPAGQAGLHPAEPDHRGGQAGIFRDRISCGRAGPSGRHGMARRLVGIQGQALIASTEGGVPRRG